MMRDPRAPRPPASRTELHVRFADVDMMQVVHHSAYLHWFEQIRFRFMREVLGVQFTQLVAAGIALPLTGCELAYKSAFRFGDTPVGYARLELFPQARFRLHYAVYNNDTGAPATTGTTTHCFLGRDFQLLPKTPALFADALERVRQAHPECLLVPEAP
jgi:acyl-CoA thioester hydrolase